MLRRRSLAHLVRSGPEVSESDPCIYAGSCLLYNNAEPTRLWLSCLCSIAGRVIVKSGDKFEHRLVRIDKPILRIPTLAIHLDRAVNTEVPSETIDLCLHSPD
jgi:hypothetical protein